MRYHRALLPLMGLLLFSFGAPLVPGQSSSNPFVGRWDFDVHGPSGIGANWLGVKDNGGQLEVWFQPVGGHVYQVKNAAIKGSHLTFTTDEKKPLVWDLTASDGKLVGTQTKGSSKIALTGNPAPKLDRPYPKAWTEPIALFNGKNLDGWQPIGDVSANHWVVKDGILINEKHGADLKTTRTFDDFKVHFEVNCPDKANSGFYSRGRYEMQLAYEPANEENPPIRSMGAIYGRVTPLQTVPRTPGKWEAFDITLVGRNVTIVRNGVKIIDNKEIEGITGGALDADEGKPGPFYIQGDHTGGLQFRNITVQVPKS